MASKSNLSPQRILVVDIGGSNIKLLATGVSKRIKFPSSPTLTPEQLVEQVIKATAHWDYEVISLGAPCATRNNFPVKDPHNLGHGWKGFDFQKAFGLPTKVINDATMQAIGCYEGGNMLFLGLGTGLGTTLITAHKAVPLEAGHLPYRKGRSFEEYLGKAGLARIGIKKWNKHALRVIEILRHACNTEDVVLGGGNAELIEKLPPKTRRVDNHAAFTGGFRIWKEEW